MSEYEPVPHQSFHASLICWLFGERKDALPRVNPSGDISTVLLVQIARKIQHGTNDVFRHNATVPLLQYGYNPKDWFSSF
jgi:hypothetical protein